MTPQQFLEKRFAALSHGDYAEVYAGYHEDAPFRRQFNDRETYIRFARQQLSFIEVKSWSCLRQRPLDSNQVECLLVMEVVVDATSQYFYELALLIKIAAGWRYHSAQKLGAAEYVGMPDQIDFHHFDCVSEKIRF